MSKRHIASHLRQIWKLATGMYCEHRVVLWQANPPEFQIKAESSTTGHGNTSHFPNATAQTKGKIGLIIKAAQYADEKHAGQSRKYNNRPYITHPIRVAGRVATHKFATGKLVAAAFLHDVVEDCGASLDEIRTYFGPTVTHYVSSLTNPPRVPGVRRADRKAADRQRLKSIDNECKVVKLIDRIDNLLEMDWSDGFAKLYAEESLLLLEAISDADESLAEELKSIANEILKIQERTS